MNSEQLYQAWLDANPGKSICTHWHEAFTAGADAMREQCAQIVEGHTLSMSSLHNIRWQDARQHIAEQIRAGGVQ